MESGRLGRFLRRKYLENFDPGPWMVFLATPKKIEMFNPTI